MLNHKESYEKIGFLTLKAAIKLSWLSLKILRLSFQQSYKFLILFGQHRSNVLYFLIKTRNYVWDQETWFTSEGIKRNDDKMELCQFFWYGTSPHHIFPCPNAFQSLTTNDTIVERRTHRESYLLQMELAAAWQKKYPQTPAMAAFQLVKGFFCV